MRNYKGIINVFNRRATVFLQAGKMFLNLTSLNKKRSSWWSTKGQGVGGKFILTARQFARSLDLNEILVKKLNFKDQNFAQVGWANEAAMVSLSKEKYKIQGNSRTQLLCQKCSHKTANITLEKIDFFNFLGNGGYPNSPLKLSEFRGSTPTKGLKYHKITNLVLYTLHMLQTDRTICFF